MMLFYIRYIVTRLLGYPINTVYVLDYIKKCGNSVCIYKADEYQYTVQTSDGDVEQFIFNTMAERDAFATGVQYGVENTGGSVVAKHPEGAVVEDEFDILSKFYGDKTKPN
jgi:hypothetical protein